MLSKWPSIGALGLTGDPCHDKLDREPPVAVLTTFVMMVGSLPAGWLYIHVATSTVEDPTMNDGVRRKLKRMTEARKDRMIDNDVANPLRILSEYLITIAVTKPPKTWIETVAHAHPPKFLNRSRKNPRELGGEDVQRMGRSAGRSENSESWTLRTQRSALEFLSTISKYTPASPEVKQAAVTAPKPFSGLMMCMYRGAES